MTSNQDVINSLLESARVLKDQDKTYKSEWRAYKAFVDAAGDLETDSQGHYLTRHNVDVYFLRYITTRHVNPRGASRAVHALQHFSTQLEHSPPAAPFTVRSAQVDYALQSHKTKYIQLQSSKSTDAHANVPTDVLNKRDEKKLIFCALRSQNWHDFHPSWNCGNQTMVRGDGSRAMRLADLRYDDAHGPGDFHSNEVK